MAMVFFFLLAVAFLIATFTGVVLSGGWTYWSFTAVVSLGYVMQIGYRGHDRANLMDALDANSALMPTIRDKADFAMKRGRQLLDCAYLNGLQLVGRVIDRKDGNDYCTVIDSIPDYTCFNAGGVR